MRRGELAALKWDRVDFATNQITITRSLGRHGLSETMKTGQKRVIPMNAEVRRVLEPLWKRQRSHFVFCEEDGNALDAHHLNRDFDKAQKRIGSLQRIRFHDMRHTFASHFMMKGGNIYDLQKILGHSSLEMTQRYAHLSPTHLAAAINIVGFSGEAVEKNNPYFTQNLDATRISIVN